MEVVEVSYDPEKVSYQQLLEVFWVNIDPLNSRGQFCDNGSQYLSAIFYLNENQRRTAENSLKILMESNVITGKIATTIRPAEKFYPAEEYHQNYYKKNPIRYHYYRQGCGRDQRLEALWKDVKLLF